MGEIKKMLRDVLNELQLIRTLLACMESRPALYVTRAAGPETTALPPKKEYYTIIADKAAILPEQPPGGWGQQGAASDKGAIPPAQQVVSEEWGKGYGEGYADGLAKGRAENIDVIAPEQHNWRPMSEAPRDGTEIILIILIADIYCVLVAHWVRTIEGWYVGDNRVFYDAICWMPTPTISDAEVQRFRELANVDPTQTHKED